MVARFHYDDVVFRRLVKDQLPLHEEREVTSHIERCADCQSKLEAVSETDISWSDVRRFLAPQTTKGAGQASSTAGPGQTAPSRSERTIDFLAPSDNPKSLGRFGRYEITEILGRGGMGVVMRGYDPALDRHSAIKVLAPELATNAAARNRFSREAKSAAAVVHEHVVPVQTVDEERGLPYLVMPVVEGKSLEQRVAQNGPLTVVEILRISMQTASGLAAAHAQGLVHRDIKPANILLENGVERVMITDFGLARAADDANMTRSGVVAGTPQYMSPEQARGEDINHRSDLFSLGSVLYFMCTGRSPFRAETMMGVLNRITNDTPRSIRKINPDIPEWLQGIVMRLLEKHPDDRFESAGEVAELLEECLAHVQQPAAVPLPASLATQSNGRRLFSISRRAAGVVTMVAAFGFSLLGMVLWQATTPPDISGRWSGEDWGQVAIEQERAGKYEGTYTRTTGDNPGLIRVKWSRIERRYNGTWREGKDRFGEISLRLVDDEIRGAWTTSKGSRVISGLPVLGDLAWKRSGLRIADLAPGPTPFVSPGELQEIDVGALRGTSDMHRLQGFWKIVQEHRPNKTTDEADSVGWVMVSNDRFVRGQAGVMPFELKFVLLHPQTRPKKINLFPADSPKDELRGIYSLDGDTLRLCVPSESTLDRPTQFAAGGESRATLATLKQLPAIVLSAGKATKPFELNDEPGLKSVAVADPAVADFAPSDGKTLSEAQQFQIKGKKAGCTILTIVDQEDEKAQFGVIVKDTPSSEMPGFGTKHDAPVLDRKNPRSVVEAYVSLAFAGRFEVADRLTRDRALKRKMSERLVSALSVSSLKIVSYEIRHENNQSSALVFSETVKLKEGTPDGTDPLTNPADRPLFADGVQLVVFLVEDEVDGWVITDVDLDSEKGAEKRRRDFLAPPPEPVPAADAGHSDSSPKYYSRRAPQSSAPSEDNVAEKGAEAGGHTDSSPKYYSRRAPRESVTAETEPAVLLSDAVYQFNQRQRQDPIGRDQPLLTDDEVIASMRADGVAAAQEQLSKDEFDEFLAIAESQLIPANWILKKQTQATSENGGVFTIWAVNLKLVRGDGTGFTHCIRDRTLKYEPSPSQVEANEPRSTADWVPLAVLVRKFNESTKAADFGQPPLTEGECIASLRRFLDNDDGPTYFSPAALDAVAKMADTRTVPRAAVLDQSGGVSREAFDFQCWNIRLEFPAGAGRHALTLRRRYLNSSPKERIDDDDIAWGPKAPDGLQVGVYVTPTGDSPIPGSKYLTTFFFRNRTSTSTVTLDPLIAFTIDARTPTGDKRKVTRLQDIVSFSLWPVPMTLRGSGQARRFGYALIVSTISERELDTSGVNLIPASDQQHPIAVVHAEPGQRIRLRFRVPNYSDLKSPQLITGPVDLTVSDPSSVVDGTANDREKAARRAESASVPGCDLMSHPREQVMPPRELTNSIGMKLVLIPAGEFLMGSSDSDEDDYDDEKPQHRVRITKPFYLGVYEVTQGQYEQLMGSNPSEFKGTTRPVESMSREDVVEFCRRLSEKDGKAYRLPTEAEWEYACRAGATTRFYWGDSVGELHRYGNYCDASNTNGFAWQDKEHNDGHDRTAPVGSYLPNGWGLYDMSGNVYELCSDWYEKEYYSRSPTDDPAGPVSGSLRVVRGGCWGVASNKCRPANRIRCAPGVGAMSVGFRVACPASADQSEGEALPVRDGAAARTVDL